MNGQKTLTPDNGEIASLGLPEAVAGRFRQHSMVGEQVVAWFQTDLNQDLRYEPGYVVLTDRRLMAFSGVDSANGFADWPVGPALTLHAQEHAGLGGMELLEGNRRVGRWRYTAAHSAEAHRLARRFA